MVLFKNGSQEHNVIKMYFLYSLETTVVKTKILTKKNKDVIGEL